MPPEGNADYCQNYAESECVSPFQAEVQPCRREESNTSSETRYSSSVESVSDSSRESASNASCEVDCGSPVRLASDASCESSSVARVTRASASSEDCSSQWASRRKRPISIEEEVQSTVYMFRKAADGAESVDNVLEEINRDRENFGIGSRRDKYYSWRVNQKLMEENLLPEISFLYARENFDQMARRGKITENSYARFRAEEIEDMSPVDRLLNRYFMTALDYAGSRGPLQFGQKYFDMRDLDNVIDSARDHRFKRAEEQREVKEILSFLTEDDGKRFDQLADERSGGITRRTIKQARREEDADDRRTLNKILKAFRELSVHDQNARQASLFRAGKDSAAGEARKKMACRISHS